MRDRLRRPGQALVRAAGTLQFRAMALLFILLGFQAVIAIPAAVGERDTLAAMARAELSDRLQLDVAQLVVGMQHQQIGITGYVETADPTYRDDFLFGQSLVAATLPTLVADANRLGLADGLPPLRTAVDAWSAWANSRVQLVESTRQPDEDRHQTILGDALFDAFTGAGNRYAQIVTARSAIEHAVATRRAGELLISTVLSLATGLSLTVSAAFLLRRALRPIPRLATVADRLALGERVVVPYVERRDEAGLLARALSAYRDVEARHRAIVDRAPIGMFTLTWDGRVEDANPALIRMLCYPAGELHGVALEALVNPDDAAVTRAACQELRGSGTAATVEVRHARRDGSEFWARLVLAAIGEEESSRLVAMVQDISEQKEREHNIARVQHELFPKGSPLLEGYELAGRCRTAEVAGGDLYDWFVDEQGALSITVGDVMGKGIPAALLAATARSALRAGVRLPSAAEAVDSAADSLAESLSGAEAFITLFHARLHQPSGRVSYVDAGHGLGFLVDRARSSRRLLSTAPPLGVLADERFQESIVTLGPGDALVVVSDGMLELDEGMVDVGRMRDFLEGAGSAEAMVDRLVGMAVDGRLADDLTALVLRRTLP